MLYISDIIYIFHTIAQIFICLIQGILIPNTKTSDYINTVNKNNIIMSIINASVMTK